MKKLSKIMESIWVDIHKQSNKDLERKEDDVDLLSYDNFVKYLKNTYKPTDPSSYPISTEPSLGNPAMMLIRIPLEIHQFDGMLTKTRVPVLSINYQTKSHGYHSYDKEQATCISLSSKLFDTYPELEDMLGEKYDVDTSKKQATPPGPVIVDSKTGPLLNSQCVDIINLVLSVLKEPLVSKKTNESVWMDIHKQSTGDIDRKEEDVNILNPNDFWKCLREIYFDGNMGYYGIGHFNYGIERSFSKNLFEITIPFGAVESVFNGKTYKKIQRLYLKINDKTYKYESIEISDDVEGLEEILSENGYVFEKRLPPKSSIVYPKNGEITNKTIINLIDLLLKTTEFPMLKRNEKV